MTPSRHFLLWRSHVTPYSKLDVLLQSTCLAANRDEDNLWQFAEWIRHTKTQRLFTDLDRQRCMASEAACFDEQFLFENVTVRYIV